MSGDKRRTVRRLRVGPGTSRPVRNLHPSFIKRERQVDKIVAKLEECRADEFVHLTLVQVQNRLQAVDKAYDLFEIEHIVLLGETEDADEIAAHKVIDDRIDKLISEVRDIIKARIVELQPQMQVRLDQQQPQMRVEVQNVDAIYNITNSWGSFSGDYTKWRAFRDSFKAAVHNNISIAPVHKLRHLLAALNGAAKSAVGSWPLEDVNYQKALDRLYAVYEDDYLIVQTLLNNLFTIPRMTKSTNDGLRMIIDTVRESLNQLGNFVNTTNWDPMIVFLVMERLDKDTYDQWQVQRSIDKVNMRGAGAVDEQVRMNNLPTWSEVEMFLENKARNMVHAEQRYHDGLMYQTTKLHLCRNTRINKTDKEFPNVQVYPNFEKGAVGRQTGFPPCRVCERDHPLWRCQDFMSLTLKGRREKIEIWNLCENCLREKHPNAPVACRHKPCLRCKGIQYHNSILCPSRSLDFSADKMGAGKIKTSLPGLRIKVLILYRSYGSKQY